MFFSTTFADKINNLKKLMRTDLNTARETASHLLNDLKRNITDYEKAEIFHALGLLDFYDNKSGNAIRWYSKELHIREKLKDIKGASSVLNNLAGIYFHQGKLDKAKDYYQLALTHREAINDRKGLAAVYNNIGGVFLQCGMIAEAFNMHSKSLEINRELNDTERISASLQNIGLIYLSQDDYQHALKDFNDALDIARKNKDSIRAIELMINIGTTYIKKQDVDEAKKFYSQCLKESRLTNYHLGLISSLKNLAYISHEQGDYQESIKYYQDCVEIAKSAGHTAEIPLALSGIGIAYARLKDYDQAFVFLLDALKMARKTGNKDLLAEIYTRLSETYEKINNHKKAFEYYKKYIAVRDELVNRENTRTIGEIKTRYEVEKKEKEAQLLKEKNEAINVYAHKLEVSNNSLKQFAHVASHDLREPLRMVSSYMGLLQRSLGDQIDPTQRQFIDFAVDGAKRMDTLIHDLLHLAKVDADPKVERISLNAIVEEVKKNLQILLKEKNAQIISSDLPAIMADRTQVMQLFQNIISNGIKYNESSQPTITIGYSASTEPQLNIADNGIGIPAELRERAFELFRRVHTSGTYQGSGIGLAICRKIVDSLGGTIAILDNPGGGSIFQITIPSTIIG